MTEVILSFFFLEGVREIPYPSILIFSIIGKLKIVEQELPIPEWTSVGQIQRLFYTIFPPQKYSNHLPRFWKELIFLGNTFTIDLNIDIQTPRF